MLVGMVTRTRLRAALATLGLYVAAALLIGYFGINAFTGHLGLRAKQDLDQQIRELTAERDRLREERTTWEHRVKLLRSEGLDADLLDERARAMLDYADPRDISLMLPR